MAKICIDGYNISLTKGTGIATYGRNLLISSENAGFQTQVLFGPKEKIRNNDIVNEAIIGERNEPQKKKINKIQKLIRHIDTRFSFVPRTATHINRTNEIIWRQPIQSSHFWAAQGIFDLARRGFQIHDQFVPLKLAGENKPDAMHWTTPLPLFVKNIPNIYTIHDLIPLRLPHTTINDRYSFMELHRKAAERADHICVVSETTRQDVIRILGIEEERITNTYQTFHLPKSSSRPDLEVETDINSTFSLGWKKYFLHFGAIEPKKNLGRIVESYLASGIRTPLVVVGGRGWLREDETALLEQFYRDSNLNHEKIRFYEYMSHDMLISLIRGAKATVFPSLYEGFGLPILESMALSTAVITSTGGSLPEVTGDAGLIVDPYDVQALTRALQEIDGDATLRQDLERRGHLRVKQFSPAAYQNRLIDLYAKVGVSPPTRSLEPYKRTK